jgi:hypothetical protein
LYAKFELGQFDGLLGVSKYCYHGVQEKTLSTQKGAYGGTGTI